MQVKRDIDRVAGSAKLPVLTRSRRANPIPGEFNGHLVDMRDEARRRLIADGYSATLVGAALNWYDEWLTGMGKSLAPDDPELQARIVQTAYGQIAERSAQWMGGIQKAFGVK